MPSLKRYVVDFTNVPTVSILGTAHNLQTGDLDVVFYEDTGSTRQRVDNVPYSVHKTTFDVVVSFAQAMSGRIVLIG